MLWQSGHSQSDSSACAGGGASGGCARRSWGQRGERGAMRLGGGSACGCLEPAHCLDAARPCGGLPEHCVSPAAKSLGPGCELIARPGAAAAHARGTSTGPGGSPRPGALSPGVQRGVAHGRTRAGVARRGGRARRAVGLLQRRQRRAIPGAPRAASHARELARRRRGRLALVPAAACGADALPASTACGADSRVPPHTAATDTVRSAQGALCRPCCSKQLGTALHTQALHGAERGARAPRHRVIALHKLPAEGAPHACVHLCARRSLGHSEAVQGAPVPGPCLLRPARTASGTRASTAAQRVHSACTATL